MKKKVEGFGLIDVLTLSVVIFSLFVVFLMSGCHHNLYQSKATDPRQCCQRLSLHHKQMSQFNRYCKVALFLSKSKTSNLGKGVKENATTAVNVCKFVFGVKTDEELVAAGDAQEYYRVRSYIITEEEDNNGWRKTWDCDPAEPSCEEF